MLPDLAHTEHVISSAVSALFVGADIGADNAATRRSRCEAIGESGETFIIEAEPIDHRAVFAQAENARTRISLLRQRRDGAAFYKAKARREQAVRRFTILVEAGSHAERIGKIEASERRAQTRIAIGARARP